MITTLNDFQVGFNVRDGEVASAAVLSRPTNRLKTEILEVNTLLGVILNDPSKIPDWIAGTYEVGNIVKYLGKTWKAIAITSATPGSNPLLWGTVAENTTGIVNDITTNATFYPTFAKTITGLLSTATVSDTKLNFTPSTGNFSSTTFTALSDENFKENIVPSKGLEVINQLIGVEFDWKDASGHSAGVIAQELEKILPFLIKESNGTKSVNYNGLIGYLINSVKEMDVRIKALESIKEGV